MANNIVRDYRPEDRDAVRRIAYETGMMGSTVGPYYRDFDSFADMFTSYYTDFEPQHALIAEQDGKVVGYLLSSLDARKVVSPMRIGLKHSLTRGVCFRPGTAAFYWRGAWDLVADCAKPGRPRVDLARYPSHTHNNLLPEARGGGIAKECFFRIFDRLKLAGSPGLHGDCMDENTRMLEFAQKALGYSLLGKPYLCPASRMPDGSRLWLRVVVRDLTDWVPGAWQKKLPRDDRVLQPAQGPGSLRGPT